MLILALPLAALEALGVGSAVAKIPDEGRAEDGFLLSTTTSMVGETSFFVWWRVGGLWSACGL